MEKQTQSKRHVSLIIDDTCDDLFEAILKYLNTEKGTLTLLTAVKRQNVVESTVIVEENGRPSLLILVIACNDLQLLIRKGCAQEYLMAVHGAVGCPVYVVVIGHPTGPRVPALWEGIGKLCTETSLLPVLVGVDFAPSMGRAADIVVAHGSKATKESRTDQHLVRADGRRKCDPSDYHTLYLCMLSEIATVSERRASVIKSTFPSLYLLLEAIDSGSVERVLARGYDEQRSCSVLDPYIVEVLSTDYSAADKEEEAKKLVEISKGFFSLDTK
uniref:Uncharacterized protein n=1 Tax=Trypanosoma congolense (strain IL3000) TaxID=1068625 RepID=G0UY11_TRYCI|nr:conserved hypothetical protein [Trypanosoma congolense IL3000]